MYSPFISTHTDTLTSPWMALYIPRSIFHFVPLLYFRPETFGHTLVECLQLLAQKIILVTRNHKTNSTTHSSATNSSRSSRFLFLIASLTLLSISSNLVCKKTKTVLILSFGESFMLKYSDRIRLEFSVWCS